MKNNKFISFLHSQKNRTFFLSAAPGNSGDILLQKGLIVFLQANNFSVTTNPVLADIILMHGGGSIDDVWWTGLVHFTELLDKYHDKMIVVAPSTIHFNDNNITLLLRKYTQDIHLFAREKYSFACLESLNFNKNVSIYLSHDTAFLLEGTEYLQRLRSGCTDSYELHAMRTDRESAIVSLDLDRVPQNFLERVKLAIIKYQLRKYITQKFPQSDTTKSVVMQDISYLLYDDFIQKVQHASVVHTDRLHVGILAALLGKPVYLYGTKYQKIKGVYDQSLQTYRNVTPLFD